MSHFTPLSRTTPNRPVPSALQVAEHEALRLLDAHARDPLTRIAVVFDLNVRRVAYRIAGRLRIIGCGLRSSRRFWQ